MRNHNPSFLNHRPSVRFFFVSFLLLCRHHHQDLAILNAPVRKLDFSSNAIRSFGTKALFASVAEHLTELRLASNLLGDNLNPIFSTDVLQSLTGLKVLDLSGNHIIALEESIFDGNRRLTELYLDRNKITTLPVAAIKQLTTLKLLSLRSNRIDTLEPDAFSFANKLERLDLRNNRIRSLKSKAFANLASMKEVLLAGNQLSHIDERALAGMDALQKLDISDNLLTEFPSEALGSVVSLKVLNVSLNNIGRLDSNQLGQLRNLQILDMSRNTIATILPGTFREQLLLKYLDLSLNSLRTVSKTSAPVECREDTKHCINFPVLAITFHRSRMTRSRVWTTCKR